MIPEVIDQIIHHLLQHNFLNETRFSQAYARGKFRTKKWGKNRIIRELKFREISAYNLKLALKEIPESDYLSTFDALAEKRMTQLLSEKNLQKKRKKLADYLSESLWKPMGAAQPGLWQLDDAEHQLAKTFCCIASNARDFARFGKLYKDHGKWNGQQLLDSTFVATSIIPRFNESPEYGYGFWLSDHLDKHMFVMRGILGQYVITIPEDNLIIIRLGHQRGGFIGQPFTDDFYTYVEEAYAMLAQ